MTLNIIATAKWKPFRYVTNENEEITNNTKPVLKIEKENGVGGSVATWQSIIVLRYFLSLRRM